jgi:DNA-binding NarL/FixJ family response regulator
MRKHTIAIVDDHLLIAKALTEIIDKYSGYEVLYEVENGQALIERMQQPANVPDMVLLDVSMPVMNGFETAAWLRAQHPGILIMALSMQDDEDSLIKMIKNGANGYLLKNVHPNELEKALDTLRQKGFYYPDWATSKVLMNIAGGGKEAVPAIQFSDRELEFFKYVGTEMSYKEMAEKMFCSPRTVESYRDSLFEKLNLKTRVGLAVYAMQHQLYTPGAEG